MLFQRCGFLLLLIGCAGQSAHRRAFETQLEQELSSTPIEKPIEQVVEQVRKLAFPPIPWATEEWADAAHCTLTLRQPPSPQSPEPGVETLRVELVARTLESTSISCRGWIGTASCSEALLKHFSGDNWSEVRARAEQVGGTAQLAEDERLAAERTEQAEQKRQAAFEEQEAFEPAWAPIAGASLSMGLNRGLNGSAFGARAGARRWFTPHMLAGAYLDYGYAFFTSEGGAGAVHLLTPTVRVELATRPYPFAAVPSTAGYILSGAVIALDSDSAPGSGIGWRSGIGVSHITNPPFFLEVYYQQVHWRGAPSRSAVITFGIGL